MAEFMAMMWLAIELRDIGTAIGAALWWWFSFNGSGIQVATVTGRLCHGYEVT